MRLTILLLFLSSACFAQQVGTNQIKDAAVTQAKLGAASVSNPKIANGAVTEAKLADGSVSQVKLADDALRPTNGGVLSDPALVFGPSYRKKYTLSVTSDIALTLSGSTQTTDSYIFISTVPDGTHAVSFPTDWVIKNNGAFDPTKTQRIELYYDGNKVYVDIFNADPIILATLLTGTVTGGTDDLILTFNNPVTITTAGWTATSSGGAVTIDAVVSGSGTTTVDFDLSRNITAGETMTISYDPGTGATTSSTGNEIAIISNFNVDTGSGVPVGFCDITVCASGCDYTTGQAASDAAVAGQTICFGTGTYRETIVGKTGVTYRNTPGEVAVISGLTDVGSTGWTVHSGNIYKKTITLPVSNNFSTGDLTSNTTIMANQVFKGSDMMMLASWPKRATVEDMLDRTKFRFRTSTSSFTASSITDSGLPATGNLAGAHIVVMGWFFTQTRQITARSGNTITFPATSSDLSFSKWYYITNHIDLLTQANEWFYSGGILYAWQTGGGSPTGLQFKARNWGFDLRGKDNVTIQGLHFIGCEPMTGDVNTDGVVIDNIRATYTNHAFTQQGGDMIYRSPLMHGMKILGNNNTIKNSEFKYTASQLIWAGPNATITNNLASDISYEGNYGAFVTPAFDADGQKVTYNTVSRLGRSAIDFGYDGNNTGGGPSHLNMDIGYNIFHTYLMLNTDGGAVYGARGSDLTGTRVHHNWIYNCTVGDQYKDTGAGTGSAYDWKGSHDAIYYDQGSGPTTNDHNVMWLSSVADVFIQPLYGKHTRWYNNTMATDDPISRESYTTYYTTDKCIIRNNIMVKHINMAWGGAQADASNNLLSTGNGNPANGYYQGADDTYNDNPLFVGSGTLGHAYEIQSGSPARNIGVHIPGFTDGYEGAAPDAGAYEFSIPWAGGDPGYVATSGEDEPYIIDNADMTFPAGTWVHAPGVAPTNTMSYSLTASSYFEANFTGSEIEYHSEKFNTHGIIEIKIDGVRVDCDPGTVGTQDCDLYEATTTNNTQLIGTWSVTPGAHTIRGTLVGVNGSATGTGVNFIDYFLATP